MQKFLSSTEAAAYAKTVHPDATAHLADNGTWEIHIPTEATIGSSSDADFDWAGTPAEELYNTPAESPRFTNKLEEHYHGTEHQGKALAVLAAHYNLDRNLLQLAEEILDRELEKKGVGHVGVHIKSLRRLANDGETVNFSEALRGLSDREIHDFWAAYAHAVTALQVEIRLRKQKIERFNANLQRRIDHRRRSNR